MSYFLGQINGFIEAFFIDFLYLYLKNFRSRQGHDSRQAIK